MNVTTSEIQPAPFRPVVLGLFLFVYLLVGIFTELRLIESKPLPTYLLEDFGYYQRALDNARNGKDPYADRSIGEGYLYPPPTLLIIEAFDLVRPAALEAALYLTVNIGLLCLMVFGITRHYGLTGGQAWYWYLLCFGFAPFLELLHIGQINMITMFGIFALFVWSDTAPLRAGLGLALAIITKVSPVFFLVYLAVYRKFKVLVVTLLAIVLATALGILRYGPAPLLEYPDVFQWLLKQFPLGPNSQSLVAKLAIANWAGFPKMVAAYPEVLRAPVTAAFTFFTSETRLVQQILTGYILLVIGLSALLAFFGRQPREPLFIITTLGMLFSPNVLWFHHYVFILLPLLIWMGWSRLDRHVVLWCLVGLLVIQMDRQLLTSGVLTHLFGHISILSLLISQIRSFRVPRNEQPLVPATN